MKRLIIFLKHVEKTNNKIFNTVSYIIKNESDLNHYLYKHKDNISKYQVSTFKL